MQHDVTFEDLIDYTEGRLPAEAQARVAAHLEAGCERCARDLRWAQCVLGLMATDELADAPATVVAQAQGLYRRRRARRLGVGGLFSRLFAPPRARVAAAGALAAALLLSGALAWGNTSVAQAASLADVQGLVEVRTAGSQVWQPAEAGMKLLPGYAVRSATGASATLAYADGSRSLLSEQGEVEITSLSGRRWRAESAVHLLLKAGYTKHELAQQQSSVQVQVDESIVAGTAHVAGYEVWVQGDEVGVRAESGPVMVQLPDGPARLESGQEGRVSGGQWVVNTPTATATAAAAAAPAQAGDNNPPPAYIRAEPAQHATHTLHATQAPRAKRTPKASPTPAPVKQTEPAPTPPATRERGNGHSNGKGAPTARPLPPGKRTPGGSATYKPKPAHPRATAAPTKARVKPTHAPKPTKARVEPTHAPKPTKARVEPTHAPQKPKRR